MPTRLQVLRCFGLTAGFILICSDFCLPLATAQATGNTQETGLAAIAEGYGGVSGHVFCADTKLPARFARVMLRRVVSKAEDAPGKAMDSVPVAETDLDGNFTVQHLRVGDYYLSAELAGYLSPTTQLSREEVEHPSPKTVSEMMKLFAPVTVAKNRNTTANIELYRGASLSGMVRFEDGSLDTSAKIILFRGYGKGGWREVDFEPLGPMFPGVATDDRGYYRISGLPAGKFLVGIKLVRSVFGTNNELTGYTVARVDPLNIYFPHSARKSAAKGVDLSEGEEMTGIDIEIPLSTLHQVAGHLVEGETGQSINAGTVTLKDADNEVVLTTQVEDSGEFKFSLVPEGAYTLNVSEAKQVLRSPHVGNPLFSGDSKVATLRRFRDAAQDLLVTSETSGVMVQLVPASAPATSTPR